MDRSAWLLLLGLAAAAGAVLQVRGQSAPDTRGFISIDCGLPEQMDSYVDEATKLRYTSDAGFTDGGSNHNVSAEYIDPAYTKRYPQALNVRAFPGVARSCYTLPSTVPGSKYLIRAVFMYGNYDGLNRIPIFDIYLGVNFWDTKLPPKELSRLLWRRATLGCGFTEAGKDNKASSNMILAAAVLKDKSKRGSEGASPETESNVTELMQWLKLTSEEADAVILDDENEENLLCLEWALIGKAILNFGRTGGGGGEGRGAGMGAPRSPSTTGAGSCRGRFWALEEVDGAASPGSDAEEAESSDAGALSSPKSGPSELRLDGFVQRAEELGGALKAGRRTAFAPGGRGSWVRPRAVPRFRRLGDLGGRRSRSAGALVGAASSPVSAPAGEKSVAVRAGASSPERQGSPASAPPRLGLSEEEGAAARGLGAAACAAGGPAHGPLGPVGSGLCSTPVGLGMEAEEGSWLVMSQEAGPLSACLEMAADPQGVERPSQRFRWLWLPKDCAIPALGFPARANEVRQRLNDPSAPPHRLLRKIAPPPPLSRSFAAAVMDRGYEEGQKRRLEGEASQWRSEGGDFGEGRGSGAGRGDGGRQDGGGRSEGNGRQGGDYRYQGAEFRYQGRGRDDWGSPPPWWEEQQRREAAQRREEEQWRQQEMQRGRGAGDRVATAGQGDRGGAGAPRQHNNKARPFKKAQGAAGGAQQPVVKGKNKASASKGGTLMSTGASILVDSVGPPRAEVCRTAASFP
ncbi:hypothetical protein QYE76_014870 [Lolium multiflorum]|uniref:Malectin-like domain-containing protein n=1 Tax=Lolium multiflorum TaxID=4521 RepID=A0AAD8U5P4_LOLMU|nr:hypothetical protein QYE76_014870 [Lolium multiflorum]